MFKPISTSILNATTKCNDEKQVKQRGKKTFYKEYETYTRPTTKCNVMLMFNGKRKERFKWLFLLI